MDKEKFIAIIKEHQALIYKVCHSYCQEAENRNDLQQDILLQLWYSMEKFDGRVKFSTWVYRIALNTAISFYRKNKKHQEKKTSIDESIISLPEMEADNSQKENITILYRFINNLNHFDKALILLYLDDFKYEEIAEILGISKTNVATKISRIKQTLKNQISNY
ncbi:MAG: sigma-70 family RNA polymerase sigma factor [Bacteroidales bacterium]|nr:sigma-70 family RNA polymerase sigma factor [Bacteroidales bacterium]